MARQWWRVVRSSSQIHGAAKEGELYPEGKRRGHLQRFEAGTDMVWCSFFNIYSGYYGENGLEQSERGSMAPVGYLARLGRTDDAMTTEMGECYQSLGLKTENGGCHKAQIKIETVPIE